MNKIAYILLADGFELIEAMTPLDVLKRGGISVITVSITNSLQVRSSQNVIVTADTTITSAEFKNGDILILPGGYPGYENLSTSKEVINLIEYYVKNRKIIAAICGAPTIFAKHNLLKNIPITCHSAVKNEMNGYNYTGNNVEISENIITAIGAGVSLSFALAIANSVLNNNDIEKIKKGMEII